MGFDLERIPMKDHLPEALDSFRDLPSDIRKKAMDALGEVLPFFDRYMNGGTSWPECAWETFIKQDVSFDDKGVATSKAYTGEAPGKGIYFFHNGLDTQTVNDVISVLYSSNTKFLFACFPCDLSQKTIPEWINYYEQFYPQDDHYAVGLAGTGDAILSHESSFSTFVFIDTALGESITANPDKKYFFTCTDDSDCYASMGALYRSCKRNGATFEYRVINATGESDILRCANKLKTYIPY